MAWLFRGQGLLSLDFAHQSSKAKGKMKIIRIILWTFNHGVLNLFYRIRHRNLFEVALDYKFVSKGSSITDSSELETYASLCGIAARDSQIFNKFRSAKVMVEALDHVSIEQAKNYRDEILKHGPWRQEFSEALRHIDSIGSPRKFHFKGLGTYSPTLFRYLKVYLDLKTLFGPLESFNFAEIGIGFGGQASVIHLLNKPISYHLYDIPPVLDLTSRFLETLKIEGGFNFNDGRNPNAFEPDLTISNYAFSELTPEIQKEYLQCLILNSPRGYITWNSLSADRLGGYSLGEILRLIPHSQILAEEPNTAKSNAIIVWGMKQ